MCLQKYSYIGITFGNICVRRCKKLVKFKNYSLIIATFALTMDIDILEGLMQCPLFKGISEREVMELMHSIRYRVVRYHKGQVFAVAGDVCLHADIVLSGKMAAHLIAPSGRSIQLTMHHSGNMLAPAFLFAKDNFYPVSVEAATDVQVVRMMHGDLERLLHADSRLMVNFIRILSNIIAYLTKKIGVLSMTVREQVCVYLKEQQQAQGSNRILLPHSRQQLADMFGVQKYSVQRCLNELQREGLIRLEGKYIQFCDCNRHDCHFTNPKAGPPL